MTVFKRRHRRCAYAAVLALLLAARAGADPAPPTGSVVVTVRDDTGVIPGASVRLAPAIGAPISGVADERGQARFDTVPEGDYDVSATVQGYADATRRLAVRAGQGHDVELALSVGQFSAEVTVTTANRREQLLLDVAEPTVLIDRTQIADTASRSAKDLLSEQSGAGIQVQAGGGQGHLSINGIPNSGVLVLVDGRRYLGKDANGNFNLEDLSLTGVDRVEVVKGAGSALYGSDALGGVVNFVTKRSTDVGTSTSLNLTGGSYGDAAVNGTAGWRAGRGGVSGTAGYRTYDGFDLSETNPQTIGQPKSKWRNADVKGDLRLTDQLLASFSGDYSTRKIRDYYFSGATQLATTVYDSQRDIDRYSWSPRLDYQVSSRTSLSADFTHGKYARDETRVFVVGGRVVPQAPWREWTDELRVSGNQLWSAWGRDHPLQAGYERREEQLRRATLSVSDPKRDVDVFWVQQEVAVASRLKLTAGTRYDHYSDFGSEWSPRTSAVFSITDRQRLHASYGHGFRPPYFGELYLNTPPSFVGNPDLQPETANTLTGGYSWAGRRFEVSADLYRARVHDGITFDLSTQPFTYANLRDYTSKGVNTALSVTLPGGFTPSVSYAYNERLDDAGVEIGGYPTHAAFVKLLWAAPRQGWRANLRGQILSDVPPADDGSYQPGYQIWSGQVSKRILTSSRHALNVFVQATNIFDESDIYRRTADGNPVQGDFIVWTAPRTFQGGLTIDLNFTR